MKPQDKFYLIYPNPRYATNQKESYYLHAAKSCNYT